MIVPNAIIRSNRRSLSLIINKDGELIVRAPRKLQLNDIMKFINEKEKWIKSKQDAIITNKNINNDIIYYESVMIFGKKYKISNVEKIKNFELTDETLLSPYNTKDKKFITNYKNWLYKLSERIIKERIEYLSKIMQLMYESVSLIDTKGKWGSCDSNANIKINYKIVMLPHILIDYVLIHELSHLVYMNHSPEFYSVVGSMLPNYKILKSKLNEFDYILNLYK